MLRGVGGLTEIWCEVGSWAVRGADQIRDVQGDNLQDMVWINIPNRSPTAHFSPTAQFIINRESRTHVRHTNSASKHWIGYLRSSLSKTNEQGFSVTGLFGFLDQEVRKA
jgi:hypothetical protein